MVYLGKGQLGNWAEKSIWVGIGYPGRITIHWAVTTYVRSKVGGLSPASGGSWAGDASMLAMGSIIMLLRLMAKVMAFVKWAAKGKGG